MIFLRLYKIITLLCLICLMLASCYAETCCLKLSDMQKEMRLTVIISIRTNVLPSVSDGNQAGSAACCMFKPHERQTALIPTNRV